MKRCPFCGMEPQTDDWMAWCYGDASPGGNKHGRISMPIASWEVRATLNEPGVVDLKRGEVPVPEEVNISAFESAPPGTHFKRVRLTRTEKQEALVRDFGEQAADLSKLMDFGHDGGDE
jgi:hypothetical protein